MGVVRYLVLVMKRNAYHGEKVGEKGRINIDGSRYRCFDYCFRCFYVGLHGRRIWSLTIPFTPVV